MAKELVSEKLAIEDVNKWLEKNRVRPSKIAAATETINALTKCIMYGELIIDADGVMVQKLAFPIGATQELKYSERVTVDAVNKKVKGVANAGVLSMPTAYIASATGIPVSAIESMDTSDMEIATMIIGFF